MAFLFDPLVTPLFLQDVADTLSNLGECALKADRPEDATRFYQRAFKIEEENFGADQPVLGSTLHCLGLCAEQVRMYVVAVVVYLYGISMQSVRRRQYDLLSGSLGIPPSMVSECMIWTYMAALQQPTTEASLERTSHPDPRNMTRCMFFGVSLFVNTVFDGLVKCETMRLW